MAIQSLSAWFTLASLECTGARARVSLSVYMDTTKGFHSVLHDTLRWLQKYPNEPQEINNSTKGDKLNRKCQNIIFPNWPGKCPKPNFDQTPNPSPTSYPLLLLFLCLLFLRGFCPPTPLILAWSKASSFIVPSKTTGPPPERSHSGVIKGESAGDWLSLASLTWPMNEVDPRVLNQPRVIRGSIPAAISPLQARRRPSNGGHFN